MKQRRYAIYLFEEFIDTSDLDKETIYSFFPKSWGYRVVPV